MPRTKKVTASKASSKSTKTRKPRAKAAAVSAAPAPVAAPTPVASPTPVAASTPVVAAPVSAFAPLFERLGDLTQQFNQTMQEGKKFATEIRRLVSAVGKFEKKMQKQTRKRRTRTGRTTESGITRPVRVSDEMC